jgi:hypothetical protein
MIHIFDDVIPKSYADQIERDSEFYIQYFWNNKTVLNFDDWKDDKIIDVGHLTCPLVHTEAPIHLKFNEYFIFMKPMLLEIEQMIPVEVHQYLRIKFNKMLRIDEKYSGYYNIPHPDDTEGNNTFTMVYYVSDSDGETVLFNEFYDKNSPLPEKLTIAQRVAPKKGRIVLFESKRFHASSNPIANESRTVINFVFGGKKK